MKVDVAYSTSTDSKTAIAEIANQINDQSISILFAYFSIEHSANDILASIEAAFPNVPIHGCTTCQGILTHDGFIQGPVVGLLSITSKETIISTGLAPCLGSCTEVEHKNNVESQVDTAISNALIKVDRVGEIPDLVLLHATTGIEEDVIEAVNKKFNTHVPLLGGTAADNDLDGSWRIVTEEGVTDCGVSVSLFFSQRPMLTSFGTGYVPTDLSGVVTKADKRTILEIDHRPANMVYREWLSEKLDFSENESLLRYTSPYPLGRYVDHLFDQPYFKLSHPVSVDKETNGLSLFTDIAVGEKVYLMQGNKTHLINRTSRVISSASESSFCPVNISGALSVFCAGSMFSILDEMDSIRDELDEIIQGHPFICPFTYGEQGQLLNQQNVHGNLMISSVIFDTCK